MGLEKTESNLSTVSTTSNSGYDSTHSLLSSRDSLLSNTSSVSSPLVSSPAESPLVGKNDEPEYPRISKDSTKRSSSLTEARETSASTRRTVSQSSSLVTAVPEENEEEVAKIKYEATTFTFSLGSNSAKTDFSPSSDDTAIVLKPIPVTAITEVKEFAIDDDALEGDVSPIWAKRHTSARAPVRRPPLKVSNSFSSPSPPPIREEPSVPVNNVPNSPRDSSKQTEPPKSPDELMMSSSSLVSSDKATVSSAALVTNSKKVMAVDNKATVQAPIPNVKKVEVRSIKKSDSESAPSSVSNTNKDGDIPLTSSLKDTPFSLKDKNPEGTQKGKSPSSPTLPKPKGSRDSIGDLESREKDISNISGHVHAQLNKNKGAVDTNNSASDKISGISQQATSKAPADLKVSVDKPSDPPTEEVKSVVSPTKVAPQVLPKPKRPLEKKSWTADLIRSRTISQTEKVVIKRGASEELDTAKHGEVDSNAAVKRNKSVREILTKFETTPTLENRASSPDGKLAEESGSETEKFV